MAMDIAIDLAWWQLCLCAIVVLGFIAICIVVFPRCPWWSSDLGARGQKQQATCAPAASTESTSSHGQAAGCLCRRPQPDGLVFPDEKCVQRAAFLSNIVYMEEERLVKEEMRKHGEHLALKLVHIGSGSGGAQKVLLAMAMDSTLYMCFRGTQGINDLFTDSAAPHTELRGEDDLGALDGAVRGEYHAGFDNRAKNYVPCMTGLKWLLQHRSDYAGGRLVLCGHSLGGAVAQLTLIRYMLSTGRSQRPRDAIAIAFGAPHICNGAARDYLTEKGFDRRLFNYVHVADPVPYFLNNLPASIWAAGNGTGAASLVKQWVAGTVAKQLSGVLGALNLEAAKNVEKHMKWLLNKGFDVGAVMLRAGSVGEAAKRLSQIAQSFSDTRSAQHCAAAYVPIGLWRDITSGNEIGLNVAAEKWLTSISEEHLNTHRMARYFDRLLQPRSTCVGHGEQQLSTEPLVGYTWVLEAGPPPIITQSVLDVSLEVPLLTVKGRHLELLVKAEIVVADEHIPLHGLEIMSSDENMSEVRLTVRREHREVLQQQGQLPKLTYVTCFGQQERDIHRNFVSVEERWPGSLVAVAYFRCLCKLLLMKHASLRGRHHMEDRFREAVKILQELQVVQVANNLEANLSLQPMHKEQAPLVWLAKCQLRAMVDPVMEHLREALTPVLGPRPMHRYRNARPAPSLKFLSGASTTVGALTAAVTATVGALTAAAVEVRTMGVVLAGCSPLVVGIAGLAGYYYVKGSYSSPKQPQQCKAEQTYRSWLTMLQQFKAQPEQQLEENAARAQEALEKRIHDEHMADKPAALAISRETILDTQEGTQVGCVVEGSPQTSLNLKHCLRGLYSVHPILRADRMLSDVKVVLVVGPENAGKTALITSLIAHAGGAVGAVDAPGNKVHTGDFKAYWLPRMGGDVLLVDCPGSDAAQSRNGDQSTWQCLERVPDLCFVLLPFAGDTVDIARSLPHQVAEHVCRKRVLVINKVDAVLNQTKESPIWEEYSSNAMEELRAKFAQDAGLSDEDVLMTVLADKFLFQEVKDNLEERGVLLEQKALDKLAQKIGALFGEGAAPSLLSP